MKLSKLLEKKNRFTSLTSDVNRKLAFAGIAIIWIFKIDVSEFPSQLIFPLFLFAVSLFFDILQYYSHSIVLKIFFDKRQKAFKTKAVPDPEVSLPSGVNAFNYFLFFLKVPFTLLAYIILISYLYNFIEIV